MCWLKSFGKRKCFTVPFNWHRRDESDVCSHAYSICMQLLLSLMGGSAEAGGSWCDSLYHQPYWQPHPADFQQVHVVTVETAVFQTRCMLYLTLYHTMCFLLSLSINQFIALYVSFQCTSKSTVIICFFKLGHLGTICNIMRVQSSCFWIALSACNIVLSIVPTEVVVHCLHCRHEKHARFAGILCFENCVRHQKPNSVIEHDVAFSGLCSKRCLMLMKQQWWLLFQLGETAYVFHR